jgi:uncharacterized membrane protein
MISVFSNFFVSIFGGNSWLATMIISMFPIIELKGAIPVGMSVDFWGNAALSETEAVIFSLVGSCLVVPILAVVFKPVIIWMKKTKLFGKVAVVVEEKVKKSSVKVENKIQDGGVGSNKSTIIKMLGVFLFVAVPLPMTGVWTGTAMAVCLGLKFWQIVVSGVLGNIVAGVLITAVCSVFPQFTSILFLIVLSIVLVVIITMIIKIIFSKRTKEQ